MKHIFRLLCPLLGCLIFTPVAQSAWPALLPYATKLAYGAASLGVAYWYKDELIDNIPESCWTHVRTPNYDNLHEEIFGQPLALTVTPGIFAHHVADPSPKKALMFYFHGWSGCGKTHMATLLLNRIYPHFRKNRRSAFVQTFTGTWYGAGSEKDRTQSEWNQLKKNLTQTIDTMLKACPNSAFIFDEIDNFPPNFLDFLTRYIDYPSYGNVQQNKAIFILLGNSHGSEINTLFHKKTTQEGIKRDDLNYDDFEEDIVNAIRLSGPLKDSKLMRKGRIRAIVPFLPLSRAEVKKCVILSFKQNNYPQPEITPGSAIIRKIVNKQTYTFEDTYAAEGCHNIDQMVEKEIHLLKKKDSSKQEL